MSSVVPDTNITMKCHHDQEGRTQAVWWFNGQVILASNNFLPEEIGFKNVRGTVINSTTSFLQVESIKVQNEGNYTCAFGQVSIVTYIVKLQRTGVIHGANISMSCRTERETTFSPIWYFNNFFMAGADSFGPGDIGLKNVHIDPNKAFLYVDSFSTQNEGNYKCILGEKETSTYHLKSTPLSLSLYCAGQECPGMLSLNTTLTVLKMECYGDQMIQADQHSWNINNLKTDFETKSRSFPSVTRGINVTVRGSMKKFSLTKYPNHTIIGCTVGNATKTVTVIVPRVASETLANYWKPAAVTGVFFIIVICFFLFQKNYGSRGTQHELPPPESPHSTVNSEEHDATNWRYESFPDFPHRGNKYEETASRALSRENMKFTNNGLSSIVLITWIGTLTDDEDQVHDIIASYIEDGVNVDAKRIWEECCKVKLSLSEHDNVLKTIGYCKYSGILMIVQDFNDMTVLQSYLSSETGASNSIRGNRMKCARGIVHGMGFLSSQEYSYPGLCIKRILVNSFGICKLYDFCSRRNALQYVKLFLEEDRELEWRLAPEVLYSGFYSEVSDVWAVGMTLWELFFGELETLYKFITSDEYDTKLMTIERRPQCPRHIFRLIKCCITKRLDQRPSFVTMNQEIDKVNVKRKSQDRANLRQKSKSFMQLDEPNLVPAIPVYAACNKTRECNF
ncbi:uncharacterized protein [Apostichopus japonicus]